MHDGTERAGGYESKIWLQMLPGHFFLLFLLRKVPGSGLHTSPIVSKDEEQT